MNRGSHSALGDLLRSWDALAVAPDPALRAQVATLLGLERRVATAGELKPAAPTLPAPPPRAKPAMPVAGGSSTPVEALITTLARHDDNDRRDDVLRGPSLGTRTLPTAPPPKPALLNPRWERALLTALVAIEEPTGEPDLREIVRLLAVNRPIVDIPLRTGASLRRGVRLFLDRNRAMEPFVDDQAQFASALLHVAGADRVAVHEFEFLPEVKIETGDLTPAVPLTAPVLVISDFGLMPVMGRGRTASVAEWRRWTDAARSAGCARLVGLVPVTERRWPRDLRRAMDLLYWDVNASVRSIRSRR